jgi:uncharacterized protein with HEPN domain
MPDENRDFAWLWDMHKAARDVVRFTQWISCEQFLTDEVKRLACERQIAVIGEAASKLSKSFRETHPEILWAAIIRQRHILVHDYGDIDYRSDLDGRHGACVSSDSATGCANPSASTRHRIIKEWREPLACGY